jgi:hypothetical protein
MNFSNRNIALDESIQCRRDIDHGIVADYVERCRSGDLS